MFIKYIPKYHSTKKLSIIFAVQEGLPSVGNSFGVINDLRLPDCGVIVETTLTEITLCLTVITGCIHNSSEA